MAGHDAAGRLSATASSAPWAPPPTLRRSSSIFGAIRNIVAAPLNWLGGEPTQSPEKRPIGAANGREPTPPDVDRQIKRPRLTSPARSGPTPPILTMHPTVLDGHVDMPAPLPPSLSRANSFAPDNSREITPRRASVRKLSIDPSSRPYSREVSMNQVGSSPRRSVSREHSIGIGGTPYRLRTSMTPHMQTLNMGSSPIRREFPSTSRQSSLLWPNPSPTRSSLSPVRDFSREATPGNRRPLLWDSKLGIVTQEDIETKSSLHDATKPKATEKAMRALDEFRQPLVPPSFANDPVGTAAIRGARKYAAPPLPPSVTNSVNSGVKAGGQQSLSGKSARMVRPYEGESGMKRLLKRRQEEVRVVSQKSESAIQTEPMPPPPLPASKPREHKRATVEDDHEDTQFQILQASGRATTSAQQTSRGPSIDIDELDLLAKKETNLHHGGRISASQAAAPSRPSNPNSAGPQLRAPKTSNRAHVPSARKPKFSAQFDDDEEDDPHLQGLPSQEDLLTAVPVAFQIPNGFSFKPGPHTATSTSTSTEMDKGTSPTPAAASSQPPGTVSAAPEATTKPFTSFPLAPPPNTTLDGKDAPISSLPFSFGVPREAAAAKPVPSFFPMPSAKITENSDKDSTPKPTTTTPVPNFFAIPTTTAAEKPGPPPFSFGASQSSATKPSEDARPAQSEKPAAPPSLNTTAAPSTPSLFSFGKESVASPSTPGIPSPFSFGKEAPAATRPPPFSFGKDAVASSTTAPTNGQPASSTPVADKVAGQTLAPAFKLPVVEPKDKPAISATTFAFGTPTPPTRPSEAPAPTFSLTVPQNSGILRPKTPEHTGSLDKMDESPTREVPTSKPSPFTFGAPAPASSGFPFGAAKAPEASTSTPQPFSFGTPAATPGAFSFGAPAQSPEKASTPFSFAPTSGATNPFGSQPSEQRPAAQPAPFSFGAPATSPSKPGPFTFGQPDSSLKQDTSRATSPFTFGASAPAPAFGAVAAAAPPPFGSPAQINQPLQSESRGTTPFSFASPTITPTNPFTFGSQPSSPAVPTAVLPPTPSLLTPVTNAPFQFGATQDPAPGTGAPNLFTIGSAPPQQRSTKALPKRKNPARR